MVFLVRFTEDDIFHICSAKHLKLVDGRYVAKWTDNKYYPAEKICKSDYKTLKNIISNLNGRVPQVIVTNMQQKNRFMSPISHEQLKVLDNNSPINIQRSAEIEIADENEYDIQCATDKECTDLSLAMQNSIIFLNEEDIIDVNGLARENIIACNVFSTNRIQDNEQSKSNMDLLVDVESNNRFLDDEELDNFNQNAQEEAINEYNLRKDDERSRSHLDLSVDVSRDITNINEGEIEENSRLQEKPFIGTQSQGMSCNKKSNKHCCFYCHKMLAKIHRHYLTVHKDEKEVREISILPVKNHHRIKLLNDLRKNGDFIYNSQLRSDNDDALVCKRGKNSNVVCCPNCKGYYNKYSIRKHIATCMPDIKKLGTRLTIQPQCRKMALKIHPTASEVLKTRIVPYMVEDAVRNIILFDEAVIHYGNHLCRKYTAHHHYAQIRSHIRNFGRLLLAIKNADSSLDSFFKILDAKNVHAIIDGIEAVAGMNPDSSLYRAPATALTLGTELRKLCRLLQIEYVKADDRVGQRKMENLLIVFESEFNVTISRRGLESQRIIKRRKKTVLPKTKNIADFREYLENKILYFAESLEKGFCKFSWTRLAEHTLVHLAVFNRKRPGETQRILIEDYNHYEVIEDHELDNDDMISKEQVKKWARVRFTGKLGRDNALLVHRTLGFRSIDLILKYREASGVKASNPYIFGEPSQFNNQVTFKACILIRKLAEESGIEDSELIRTRLLRQHLATETASHIIDNRLESRVSDFMSHQKKIHEDYYVLTKKKDDITKVSTLLENFSSRSSVSNQPVASTSRGTSENQSILSEKSDNDSEMELSQAEINFVLGKTTGRLSWNSDEKQITRNVFHDEIYGNKEINMAKVKLFHKKHLDIFPKRSPHLIRQWILGERKRLWNESKGLRSSRQRWTTPEKDAVEESVTLHSSEFSLPSVAECELLISENPALKNRSPACLKSYIYSRIKKLTTL